MQDVVTGEGNFVFYNTSNASGLLTAVSSLANSGGSMYWKVDANGIDAQGRVLSANSPKPASAAMPTAAPPCVRMR